MNMDDKTRLMPERFHMGTNLSTTMSHAIGQWQRATENPDQENPHNGSTIMGFVLPHWQRDSVWSEAQMVSFLESAWRGVPLGTYSYNRCDLGLALDNLLIDGQQRMIALQRYLEDGFAVFGHRWSEVTVLDRRAFEYSTSFPCYETQSTDEQWLRDYYNRMNFGGTAHKKEERA